MNSLPVRSDQLKHMGLWDGGDASAQVGNLFGSKGSGFNLSLYSDSPYLPFWNQSFVKWSQGKHAESEVCQPAEQFRTYIREYMDINTSNYETYLINALCEYYRLVNKPFSDKIFLTGDIQCVDLVDRIYIPDQDNKMVAFTVVGVVQYVRGHFIAYVKRDGIWYCANDSRIQRVNMTGELPILSEYGNARMLLYKKVE